MLKLEQATEADAKKGVAAIILAVLRLLKAQVANESINLVVGRMEHNLIGQARGQGISDEEVLDLLAAGVKRSPTALPPPVANLPTDCPAWYPCTVSRHSIERFELHHPQCRVVDVLWDVSGGVELDHRLALPLMGRVHDNSPGDIYILGRRRMGIHVITKLEEGAYKHCTYLRMATERVEWARDSYPPAVKGGFHGR